ncbi:unnamed protein product [Leptosia nina]|uniref:Peptidase S1 domain-containing protein n=1 Tax=Leptosia nina TaxID=320188 RepID=A0AAV1JE59_9NEOP
MSNLFAFLTILLLGSLVESKDAPPGSLPFVASIQIDGKHVCSGTIFPNNWVITAAEYVYDKSSESLTIVVGTVDLEKPGSNYSVAEIVVHPKYDYRDLAYDLALLRVGERMEYSDKVYPIFPAHMKTEEKANLLAAGWRLNKDEDPSSKLQVKNVTAITNEECKAKLRIPISDSVVCTSDNDGDKPNNYIGDTGGPLVEGDVLAGVIIIMFKPQTRPGLSARVFDANEWINKTLRS